MPIAAVFPEVAEWVEYHSFETRFIDRRGEHDDVWAYTCTLIYYRVVGSAVDSVVDMVHGFQRCVAEACYRGIFFLKYLIAGYTVYGRQPKVNKMKAGAKHSIVVWRR